MIKHILNENGVEEIFQLEVVSGEFAGIYNIGKPDGWDDINISVDINEEFFNVENFVIGEAEKLSFHQYSNPDAFDILQKVFDEQGVDAVVRFYWKGEKDGVLTDFLTNNFEINFNKYAESFSKSMFKIEVELKQNKEKTKFFNREETTVDLFANKDVDGNAITPVSTFPIGYKKGDKKLSNFYTFDLEWQANQPYTTRSETQHMFAFVRADGFEIGTNTNEKAGEHDYWTFIKDFGDFIYTPVALKNVKIEISNLKFWTRTASGTVVPNATLFAVIKNGGTIVNLEPLVSPVSHTETDGTKYGKLEVVYEEFSIGSVPANHSIDIAVMSLDTSTFQMIAVQDNTTIEITASVTSPIVRTDGVRLIDAINQIAKSYTNGNITAESNILGEGGSFYDSSISTGVYLRGLPPKYIVGQKMKTSIKSILQDGSSPLMALGYDILDDKLIVENTDYFFKDLASYDLSGKPYSEEDYKIENDQELMHNTLIFGSSKFSTNVKADIQNFNTKIEITTPLESVKSKFDKTTSLIIDEFKIQEMIEDKTSSTNDNDDDLVLIDMVNLTNFWDDGIFEDTYHENFGGKLRLFCGTTPFDTTLMAVGKQIQITEGLNIGTWTILAIYDGKIEVNKTTGIQTGTVDTNIRYQISNLTKNRTGGDGEGFTNVDKVYNKKASTNLRHNPKYQFARWFRFIGGAFKKKAISSEFKVTNYKNNDEAEMEVNSVDLNNELQGLVVVGENETMERMMTIGNSYFSGNNITIKLNDVYFYEFFELFKKWKFGIGNDRNFNRGFFKVNTPKGVLGVFPFGKKALEFNKKENTLKISGKIK